MAYICAGTAQHPPQADGLPVMALASASAWQGPRQAPAAYVHVGRWAAPKDKDGKLDHNAALMFALV